MTVVGGSLPKSAGQGDYCPCYSFLLQTERIIPTGEVFTMGRELLHRANYTISFYTGSQDYRYKDPGIRRRSEVFYHCVLQDCILQQRHKRSCQDCDSKPTARTFPRTLSRMEGLKSYNNVRKYFNPTIKVNQNRIQLFWVEVFSIIRNENAKQAKSFRTQ